MVLKKCNACVSKTVFRLGESAKPPLRFCAAIYTGRRDVPGWRRTVRSQTDGSGLAEAVINIIDESKQTIKGFRSRQS